MTYIGPTKAFAHLDRLSAWQAGGRAAPVTVEWDLSNRCYLGCEACHFAHTHTRGPWVTQDRRLPLAFEGTGDLADTALVKRALTEMHGLGVQGIVWSGGGEPTTHPDYLPIMQHAAALGLQQGLYTAGGLLTEASAKALAGVLTWAVVSLDCADAETYAAEKRVSPALYQRACAGLHWLTSAQACVVGASFLLYADNWRRAPEMHAIARRLGATYTTFRPRIDFDPADPAQAAGDRSWITEALPLLTDLAADPHIECDPSRFVAYRDWTGHGYSACHGIKLNATITPDGRVWVCVQRRGVGGSQVGDLRTESFQTLWDRHPGVWTDFSDCRVMCRLHLVNSVLATVFEPRVHTAFV